MGVLEKQKGGSLKFGILVTRTFLCNGINNQLCHLSNVYRVLYLDYHTWRVVRFGPYGTSNLIIDPLALAYTTKHSNTLMNNIV